MAADEQGGGVGIHHSDARGVLPGAAGASGIIPSLKTDTWMLKETQPQPVTRTYRASERDVEQRALEIAAWKARDSLHADQGALPPALPAGEEFTKEYQLPSKVLFWSKQPVLNGTGQREARGYLYPELIVAEWLGVPWSASRTP